MDKDSFPSTVVEHQGEIDYPLTSPNQPRYPKYDEDLPHDFAHPSHEADVVSIDPDDALLRTEADLAEIEEAKKRVPSVLGRTAFTKVIDETPPIPRSKPALPSAEQNANARRFEREHYARTVKQIYDRP